MAQDLVKDDFLTSYEAEYLIEALKPVDIKEYASRQWYNQHETLDRLNIQAHKNAQMSTDEFVMDTFVVKDKIEILIYDLLTCEVWK